MYLLDRFLYYYSVLFAVIIIFSGLISSTLLDTYLTPALFWLFGRKDTEHLMASSEREAL